MSETAVPGPTEPRDSGAGDNAHGEHLPPQRIAFIGLGVMGRAMARNLLAAGYEVTVHNRSPGPMQELVAHGARAAGTPAAAARDAEVVLTCVTDGDALATVLLGDDGVLREARRGTVIVDHSTTAPAAAVELAAQGSAAGCVLLDAPVSGGEQGAIDGTLSIMVGGAPDALARVRPVLEVVGSTVASVGPTGSGQRVKAANQLLVGGLYALVSEALLLLETGAVDVPAALEVLAGGLAGSRILEQKGAPMHMRSFRPGGRVDLQRKDLAIAQALAEEAGVAMPVSAVVAQLYRASASRGDGALDHSAVLLVVEALAGRAGARATGSERTDEEGRIG